MVVVPIVWVSMVNMVLNVPYWLVITVVIVWFIPKAILTLSLLLYPSPVRVTLVPTGPVLGTTPVIWLLIQKVFIVT